MSADLHPIVYKAEFLLLERSVLATSGPTFRIVHRFRIEGAECREGEEVFEVFLLHRGRSILLNLSLALRLVFDYLARHRRTSQSATQIAAGIRAAAFYRSHGLNSGVPSRRRISRTAVKEYVKRIRKSLEIAFREASIAIDPAQVLVSEKTEGNEVLYRLRAIAELIHCEDLPSRRA